MRDEFPLVMRPVDDDGHRRPFHVIACRRCGKEDRISAHNRRLTPEDAAGAFRHRGWRVGDVGKHRCPACVRVCDADAARKRREREKKAMIENQDKTIGGGVRSELAATAIPIMYQLISDNFDAANKRYKAGWSDDRVSKECGLSQALVAFRREKDLNLFFVDSDAPRRELVAALDALVDDLATCAKTLSDAASRAKAAADNARKAG